MKQILKEKASENSSSSTVDEVKLRNFRNYASVELCLGSGLNVLSGPNAQGKTNLLEALYLLSTTRLLRGSKDSEAIHHGASQAQAEAILQPSRTELAIAIEAGKRKSATLNRLKLPRAADLIGRLPCVCISAFDMAIVRGGPEDRRLFLDLELSQLYPAYLNHLTHYKRALEHRNALLRRAQGQSVSSEEFEPWEATLAEHGEPIRRQRVQMVEELKPVARSLHREFAGQELLELTYVLKDTAESHEELLQSMEESRNVDIQRGATSIGPHRDDLSLLVDGREARYFGSQGQQRTAVLSLKLATHHRQHEVRGFAPMLLLDDVLSDLDEQRRSQLVGWLLDHARQGVLTCTEPEAAGKALLERAALWKVHAGNVQLA